MTFADVQPGRRIRARHIIEMQEAIDSLPGVSQLANMRIGTENVLDHGAIGDGVADDTLAILAAQAAGNPFFPEGTYRITTWLPMISNRRWFGQGVGSVIYNDKTNVDAQKHPCILPGLMHPELYDDCDSYALNSIAANAYTVTCTTAGHAANFSVGELVIVGSNTFAFNVPRHAQLNKITAISSGVITLADTIAVAISDGMIWKINGYDSSSSTTCYAVENVVVEDLAFMGGAALAYKSAVYNGVFRNFHMLDVHHFHGGNMFTHCLFENWMGVWSGRYLELANNSYDVTCRHFRGQFRPPSGFQAGESMYMPIHVGEQPYLITLDDIQCHVDSRFTEPTELAQIKGNEITIRDPDWKHGGTQISAYVFGIYKSPYAGHPYRNTNFYGGRMSAPGFSRIGYIGEGTAVTDADPVGVGIYGTILEGAVTSEALQYQTGKGHTCAAINRTGKDIAVATYCQYPGLNGYRMTS